jgi:hypothetical protein
MKKKSESLSRELGPVKIYGNDIEGIVGILKKSYDDSDDRKPELTITIGNYELSSIEELSEIKKGKQLREMEIELELSRPYVRTQLHIREESVRLYCSNDSAIYLGIFTEIENLLLLRRRKWDWISHVTWFLAASATSATIFVIFGQINNSPFLSYIGYSIIGLFLIFGLLSFFTRSIRKSEIILANRYEQTTFWERNRDKLLVGLIIGLISFVLGIVGTILAQSILANP